MRKIMFFGSIILLIFFSVALANTYTEKEQDQIKYQYTNEVLFHKDQDEKSTIFYPQIIFNPYGNKNITQINDLLKITALENNPMHERYLREKHQTTLLVASEVSYLTEQIISVRYSGVINIKKMFHPIWMGYGVTINRENNQLIGLTEWLVISPEFISVIKEKSQIMPRHTLDLSEEEKKKFFYVWDEKIIKETIGWMIKYENLSRYYVKSDGIVLFFPTIQAKGNYIEVFINQDDLKPFLKQNDLFDVDKIW